MTRINAGIPVKNLSDQHLLAEHREIKRLPNTKFTGEVPKQFTLGKGHVLFFSDKSWYTFRRYVALYEECKQRGFNVTYFGDNWSDHWADIRGNYNPSKEDAAKVVERITERVLASKQTPRYYGKEISKEEYINMLNEVL